MAWYLINDDERVRIRRGQILGREDFENAAVLSRHHFKFSRGPGGKLMVRDLGSRNGTSLRGEPIGNGESYPVSSGDVLTVAGQDFTVAWRRPTGTVTWAVVAGLVAVKLADPTAAFGLALGLYGLITFIVSAALATCVASLILDRVIPPRFVWPYVAAVVVVAGAIDASQLYVAGRHLHLADRLVQNRVDYFCNRHFNGRQCILQVQMCPHCTVRIDKRRRLKMVSRLQSARRMPAAAGPASGR